MNTSPHYYTTNNPARHDFRPIFATHGKCRFIAYDMLSTDAQAEARKRFGPDCGEQDIRNWAFVAKKDGTLSTSRSTEPCPQGEAIGTVVILWDAFWKLPADHAARVAYRQGERQGETGRSRPYNDLSYNPTCPLCVAYTHGMRNAIAAREHDEYTRRHAQSMARANAPI